MYYEVPGGQYMELTKKRIYIADDDDNKNYKQRKSFLDKLKDIIN